MSIDLGVSSDRISSQRHGEDTSLDQLLAHHHQDLHHQNASSIIHAAPHDQSALLAFHGPPQLDQQDITFSHQIPQSHQHIDSMAREYLLKSLTTDLSSPAAALLMEDVINASVNASTVSPMVSTATLTDPVHHDLSAMDEDGGVDELALYTYIHPQQEDDDIDNVVVTGPSMDQLHEAMLIDTDEAAVVVGAADHASPLSTTTDSIFDTSLSAVTSPEPSSSTTSHISLPRLTIETSAITTRSSYPAVVTAPLATGAFSQSEKNKGSQWLSVADDTQDDGMENVDAVGASALLASPSSSGSATPELLSPALGPLSASSLCSSGLVSPLSPRADDSLPDPSKSEDLSMQSDDISTTTTTSTPSTVSVAAPPVQTPPSPLSMALPASISSSSSQFETTLSKTRKISQEYGDEEGMESGDECLAPKKRRKTSHAQQINTITTQTCSTNESVGMCKSAEPAADVQDPPSPLSLGSPDPVIKEEQTDCNPNEVIVKIEADEMRPRLSPSPSGTSSSSSGAGNNGAAKRPWTETEEKLLLELVDKQMPIKEIAQTLNRTVHSVRSRRQVLTDPGFVKGHGHSQPRRSKPDPSSKLPTYSQMAFLSLARLPSLQGTLNDVAAMVEQLFSPHLNRIPRTGHKNLQIWRAQISDALAHEKGHPRPRFESFGVKRGRQWVYRLTEFGRGVMEAMGGIDAICEDLLRCNGMDEQQRLALQGGGLGGDSKGLGAPSAPAGIGRAPQVAIKIEPDTPASSPTVASSKSSKASRRNGTAAAATSSAATVAESGSQENTNRPDPAKAIADAMAAMSAALAAMSAAEDEKEAAALAAANNGLPVVDKPARGRGRASTSAPAAQSAAAR